MEVQKRWIAKLLCQLLPNSQDFSVVLLLIITIRGGKYASVYAAFAVAMRVPAAVGFANAQGVSALKVHRL